MMRATLFTLAILLGATLPAYTAPRHAPHHVRNTWVDGAGKLHIKRVEIQAPEDPGRDYKCLDGRTCAGWRNGVMDWYGVRYIFM